MKFVEFITSNKVVSITTGYLLAGAIREFLESVHDDTIYPVIHGVLNKKRIKLNLEKILKDFATMIFMLYGTFLLIKSVKFIRKNA